MLLLASSPTRVNQTKNVLAQVGARLSATSSRYFAFYIEHNSKRKRAREALHVCGKEKGTRNKRNFAMGDGESYKSSDI